jgi:hypothetical protein
MLRLFAKHAMVLGPSFKGLGKSWVSRFLEWHSNHPKAYNSHSLDHSRPQAGNPHTKAFYDLLEKGKAEQIEFQMN